MSYTKPSFDFRVPADFVHRAEVKTSPNPEYRTEFMRDRDRIMYSSAFRRLAGKTQIYLVGRDDNQRNRLTHTLEVAQISRTVAQALGLDCDLTEAIALGHDIGHAPFGHAGEQILHEIMVPDSPIKIKNSPFTSTDLMSSNDINSPLFGFKHNVQSVRVAVSVENNYGVGGLNLTNYTLWGMLHHSSLCYGKGKVNTPKLDPVYRAFYNDVCSVNENGKKYEAWSFEAFVVAEADEIAQWHHDLEDALRSKAMSTSDVCRTLRSNLGEFMSQEDAASLTSLEKRKNLDHTYITVLSRIVVNTLVNLLIKNAIVNLDKLWKECSSDKRSFFLNHEWNDPQIQNAIKLNLKKSYKRAQSSTQGYANAISEKIHHSRDVERMNAKGQYIIKKLFEAYYDHPQQLPNNIIVQYMIDMGQYNSVQTATVSGIGAVRKKFEEFRLNSSAFTISARINLMRRICDHIAGMTDHYAIEEYTNLYG